MVRSVKTLTLQELRLSGVVLLTTNFLRNRESKLQIKSGLKISEIQSQLNRVSKLLTLSFRTLKGRLTCSHKDKTFKERIIRMMIGN